MKKPFSSAIVPVILGGGIGSRLWPLSRSDCPKQYNTFFSDHSLFQETLQRSQHFSDRVLIVAGEAHRYLILEQSAAVQCAPRVLLEPSRRDTAPAVALAAHHLEKENDPLMLVMPADHVIHDVSSFYRAVQEGIPFAEAGHLVLFGCRPHYPSTAYGYIQRGDSLASAVFSVQQFHEKPALEVTTALLAAGDCDWNAGIFLFRSSVFLAELKKFSADISEHTQQAMMASQFDGHFLRPEASCFHSSPACSVDYAVMEKTDKAVVIPVDMGWSDVGSWQALHDELPKDEEGNTVSGDVIVKDSKNTYLRSTHRLVMGLGLKDLVVVETRDAVLVADKSQAHLIKQGVEQLKEANRLETEVPIRFYRAWGFYEMLEMGDGLRINKIYLKPKAHLSLQMHKHRSEHWVILSGQAEVGCADEILHLGVGQSTYIPANTKHYLKNLGQSNLEVIEVQVGNYFGDDDVHRFEAVGEGVEVKS